MKAYSVKSVVRGSLLLAALTFVAFAASAQMSAGVAKAKISTDEPLVMVNGRTSEGVAHDIYARALTLFDGEKRLVFITYDLNCLDHATPFLRVRLRDELGIPPEYLLLLATHNHNAPIQIVPDNFEYGKWLAEVMFDLVKEAVANERGPVTLEFGSGQGYFVMSTGNAPTDYEIQVLKVSHDGNPLALLFNQGSHPLQATVAKIDPGHPGFAMDLIEERMPGVQAMYADQCGGNQFAGDRNLYRKEMMEARRKGPEHVDHWMEMRARAMAEKLADATLEIASGELTVVDGPIASSMKRFDLPLAEPMSYEDAKAMYAEEKERRKIPDDIGFVPYPNDFRSTNWMRMLLRYHEKGLPFPETTGDMVCSDDTYLIHWEDKEFLEKYDDSIHDEMPCVYNEVIVAKIGRMPIVAIQGEVCAPIGMRIKDTFRRERPLLIFGYMGEHNLYIPTREIVRLDAYQAQTLRIQYASPVGWDPSVEDVTVEGVVDMVHDIIEATEDR
jgi:neutral ceramidase